MILTLSKMVVFAANRKLPQKKDCGDDYAPSNPHGVLKLRAIVEMIYLVLNLKVWEQASRGFRSKVPPHGDLALL
jgi:hypothetical protein